MILRYIVFIQSTLLMLFAYGYREYEHKYNYELTPMLSHINSESNTNLKNENSIGFRWQFNNYGVFKTEYSFDRSISNIETNSSKDTAVTRLGFNEIYDLDTNYHLKPYVLTGVGLENFSDEVGENVDDFYFNYGIGFRYNLKTAKDLALRVELKHIIALDGLDNRYGLYVGLSIPYSKTYKILIVTKMVSMIELIDVQTLH